MVDEDLVYIADQLCNFKNLKVVNISDNKVILFVSCDSLVYLFGCNHVYECDKAFKYNSRNYFIVNICMFSNGLETIGYLIIA